MARWQKGERTVQYLIGRGRLENIEAEDLASQSEALLKRASLRVGTTAAAAPAERFRRTRHSAQYFDPRAVPITEADTSWAIGKATDAVSGVRTLLEESPPGRFVTGAAGRA
ncbi:MAG: hypothetical protein J2P25_00435 [Nocardiopsaceae bacterium]|nr:hypothetical protein [Nocardiopsaceae bacterium]